jgi:hypothetical protein
MDTFVAPVPWATDAVNGVRYDRLISWEVFNFWVQEMARVSGGWVFRGQAKEEWKLESRLARYFRDADHGPGHSA